MQSCNTPTIAEIYNSSGVTAPKIFAKIDLRQAYHQLEVHVNSRKYMTIVTSGGRILTYRRLCQGCASAPTLCTFALNQHFRKYPELYKCIIIFLDDILLCSQNEEHHLKILRVLFQALREGQLAPHPLKCELFNRRVNFLGFTLYDGKIIPQAQKLTEIKSLPGPINGSSGHS